MKNMKKVWHKQEKLSSSKAKFVNPDDEERFKYKVEQRLIRLVKFNRQNAKRTIMSIIQKTNLMKQIIDWSEARRELTLWVVETFLEGLSANFAMWALFGSDFNICTTMAYGIIIKQGLSIYWRLKNGSTSKIPEKHQ